MPKRKIQNASMKVVTINVPKAYLAHIKEICDSDNAREEFGFEPSRSEWIRHAIKDKIINDNELGMFFKNRKKGWQVQNRINQLEEELTLIKVPYTNSKKVPLGNGYYNKGINEA